MSANLWVRLSSPLTVSSAELLAAMRQAASELLGAPETYELNLVFWAENPELPLETVSFTDGSDCSFWDPDDQSIDGTFYCFEGEDRSKPLMVSLQIPKARNLNFAVTVAAMVAIARLSGSDEIEDWSGILDIGAGEIKIADLVRDPLPVPSLLRMPRR